LECKRNDGGARGLPDEGREKRMKGTNGRMNRVSRQLIPHLFSTRRNYFRVACSYQKKSDFQGERK
jgi:hypothetical protein